MGVNDIMTIRFQDGAIQYLDQSRLPGEEVIETAETIEDVWEAIHALKVRGAPLIGIAAAYGMVLSALNSFKEDGTFGDLVAAGSYLRSSRPTAVNLEWAVQRMLACYAGLLRRDAAFRMEDPDPEEDPMDRKKRQLAELLREAVSIQREEEERSEAMAEYGLSLLEPGMGILTHCNAGALATSGPGTALAPVHLGGERGYDFHVYADETRPLLQGARLTAFELSKSGIPVTLICDNMANTVMKQGKVQAVLVGCDRMALNGDGANKIGTSGVAVLAKEHGIPFYMFVPTSSIDPSIASGEDIVIEERDGEEIRSLWYREAMAPEGIDIYNPAFDVTDHQYITAVVTEKGIVYPPYEKNLRALLGIPEPEEHVTAERPLGGHLTLEIQ